MITKTESFSHEDFNNRTVKEMLPDEQPRKNYNIMAQPLFLMPN